MRTRLILFFLAVWGIVFYGITQLVNATEDPASVHIISRQEWGADESLRIWKSSRPVPQLKEINLEFINEFAPELKIIRKVTRNSAGEKYTWPIEYTDKIRKIVIHHSDTKSPITDTAETVRAIYHWHAITKGWGDIGYNFLIGPDGNIYEGRAGGDYVVGAHAALHNVGSLGIVLLGNYDDNQLNHPQYQALINLIAYLCKKYQLDPLGIESFRGKNLPNILGHHDVGKTRCPGTNLIRLLPTLRLAVAQKTNPSSFAFQIVSTPNANDLIFPSGVTSWFALPLKNTGNFTWPTTSLLEPLENNFYLTKTSRLTQAVAPGEITSFDIEIKTSAQERFEVLNFNLKTNGQTLNNLLIPLLVKGGQTEQYEITHFKRPRLQLFYGEEGQGYLMIRNLSLYTWHLGEIKLVDENGQTYGSLLDQAIPPGAIGKFEVKIKAPWEKGSFRHFLNLTKSTGEKLTGSSIKIVYKTLDPDEFLRYRASFPVENRLTLVQQQGETFTLTVENRDARPWLNLKEKQIEFKSLGENVPKINQIFWQEDRVEKGTTGHLVFDFAPPLKERNAQFFLYLSCRGEDLFQDNRLAFSVTIVKAIPKAELVTKPTLVVVKANQPTLATLKFKNTGNLTWKKNQTNLGVFNTIDQGKFYTDFWLNPKRPTTLLEESVKPGEIGTFQFLVATSLYKIEREQYKIGMAPYSWLEMLPVTLLVKKERVNTSTTTPISPIQPTSSNAPLIRVKLGFSGNQVVIKALNQGNLILTNDAGQTETLSSDANFRLEASQVQIENQSSQWFKVQAASQGVLVVTNWEERSSYNQFRGTLEIRPVGDQLILINELPLEDYLKGLAEEPNSEPYEKIKALVVLARSYAYWYLQPEHRKFPNEPYDASDDPAVFQKYLGYGFELKAPNVVRAVEETQKEVVTYQDQPIKTPYFSQDDGRTRSAEEVWGWKDTPYLQSVSDPWCDGLKMRGHGVGLSGCGSRGQALAGKTYQAIIKYYFQGVGVGQYK